MCALNSNALGVLNFEIWNVNGGIDPLNPLINKFDINKALNVNINKILNVNINKALNVNIKKVVNHLHLNSREIH